MCQKCLKDLEAAFVLRNRCICTETSYFQLRRDELEDMDSESYQEDDEKADYPPEISIKSETVAEPFTIQFKNDDPLVQEIVNTGETDFPENDYDDATSDETNISDSDKDEDYGVKKKKEVKCSHCEKVLSGPLHLKRHIQNVHERKKNFSCETCDRAFKTKYNLAQHLLRHIRNPSSQVKEMITDTSNSNRPFSCETCGNFFKTIAALRQHKIIHTGNSYKICNSVLISKISFFLHRYKTIRL